MRNKSKFMRLVMTVFSVAVLVGCNGCAGNNGSESSDPSISDSSGSSDKVNGSGDTSGSETTAGKLTPGQEIYEKMLVYDTSRDPYDVAVRISSTRKVTAASSGRYATEEGEVSSSDGIVNLKGSFLSQIGHGERDIRLTFDDDSVDTIEAFFATKVIKTAQDFQNINNELSGTYILGNDIDFTGFGNFQPLGYYLDEQNPRNEYFHGILEGNGYAIKNVQVYYNSELTNNQEAYSGWGLFDHEAHQNGDNIGLFQVIGSSGIVRNVIFDGVRVRGRTIVGVIAGNVMGTVYNCIVTGRSSVQMSTHFYDNDCNTGIAFGIVAGSGDVQNCISLSSGVSLPDIYKDYGDDYIGKIGNGWDHSSTPGNTDNTWQFANVNRPKMNFSSGEPVDSGSKEIDSNGSLSNGVYSFAGKVWGLVRNSYALAFNVNPFEGESRPVHFGQTHLASLKPGSGPEDLGSIDNCFVKTATELKDVSLYDGFDLEVFDLVDGNFPTLHQPLVQYTVAE